MVPITWASVLFMRQLRETRYIPMMSCCPYADTFTGRPTPRISLDRRGSDTFFKGLQTVAT